VFLASLEKAQADLEWVGNKLEQEFSSRYKGGEINPMDVMTRIHRLNAELPAVASECSEVLQAKQLIVDAAKHSLVGNTEELQRLERKAGIEHSDDGEAALRSFHTAVQELEAKLRLPHAGAGALSRAELNEAVAHSIVS